MRTLVISDIHFGAGDQVDLLRRPELRAPLLAKLADVDRLILLGDLLELRHGPRRSAVNAARPFFEDLGRVFADREVIVLAGNHDHGLVEPWLAHRAERREPSPLAVEERFTARACSPAVAALAQWAAPSRVSAAYPGLWLRPDVYATHGHYLDCHLTVPTLERLGFAGMGRIMGRPISAIGCADDYEAVMRPLFAWVDAVAQPAPTGVAFNGQVTIKAWHALRPSPGRRRSPLALSMRAGFPLAVAALNRIGLGPLHADISRDTLRRSGLRAMAEVAQRLGVADGPGDSARATGGVGAANAGRAVDGDGASAVDGDVHVIFGHTHRPGPLPGDDPAEWTSGRVRLHNCGSWSYDAWWIGESAAESPYWPGGCVIVDDEGPPQFRRLLDDRSRAELTPHGGYTPA